MLAIDWNTHFRSIKVIDLLIIIFSFTLSFLRNLRYIRYMKVDDIHLHFQIIFCGMCIINNIDLENSIFEINTINSSVICFDK